MRYRYKQTGVIVESGDLLDSAVYIPITEEEPESITEDIEEAAVIEESPAEDVKEETRAHEEENVQQANAEAVEKEPAVKKTASRKRAVKMERK